MEAIYKMPEKSAVLLHASCQNPTGCDPTQEEWRRIAYTIRERNLLPIFDCAYQGFGEGLDKDVEGVRLFVQEGCECMIAYSCSKNFGLYNQRVGALFIVNHKKSARDRILSQLKRTIRVLYSNPPAHGVAIVEHILKQKTLRAQWEQEVDAMRARLQSMRIKFVEGMSAAGTKTDFSPLLQQKGMFSLLDLKEEQLQQLIDCFAIYMVTPGRLSIAGLNDGNLDRVINALISVINR
jgi:aspartate/tyrosine/aromatic aminotransferase